MPTPVLDQRIVKDRFTTPEGEHWELIHGKLVITEESYGKGELAWEIGMTTPLSWGFSWGFSLDLPKIRREIASR